MNKKIITLATLFIIVLAVTLAAAATIDSAQAAGKLQLTVTDFSMTVITTPIPWR